MMSIKFVYRTSEEQSENEMVEPSFKKLVWSSQS